MMRPARASVKRVAQRFRVRWLSGACAAAIAVAGAGAPIAAQTSDTIGSATSLRALTDKADSEVAPSRIPAFAAALGQFYARSGWQLVWTANGRATPQALDVIDFFAHAQRVGLDSADYDAGPLSDLAARLGITPHDTSALALFDVSLSRSLIRLLAHLSAGRVDPLSLGFELAPAADVDLAGIARAVSGAHDVPAAIAQAEPGYRGYRALETALPRYRTLAADSSLRPPLRARASIRPGDQYADMPALRRLLIALGDLAADTPAAGAGDSAQALQYSPAIVAAIERFQERHGLDSDGIIGPATFAQLRVPLARRVRQIELTMERWRWLPHRPPARYVAINIPAFRLYAFENDSTAAHPALAMKVIIGQAEGRHDTPVFVATMRQVVFRPYWDVPRSIARKELIPLIRHDPRYASREALEIVRGDAEKAAVFPITSDNLARVALGALRLRQRPGPNNALGLVKFVFPNAHNVYLHGTPAQELFARARRDFSHGCIRVEHPAAFASYVLGGQDDWNPFTIDAAMDSDGTRSVGIARPVEVFILYATAAVSADGVVSFYPDLYGHDASLEKALQRVSAHQSQNDRPLGEDQ